MKKARRIAAMIAAMAMAATMAVPAMSFSAGAATAEENGNSITVTNKDKATHTYAAYQIFKGNFTGETLNDITWGDGVDGDAILAALHDASGAEGNALYGLFPAETVTSARGVAEVLGSKTTGDSPTAVFADDSEKTQAFAAIVGANLEAQTSGVVNENTISALPDGYYLIMDTAAPVNPDANNDSLGDNPNSGAKTRFIVKVAGGANQPINVDAKHSAPTVDKQVQDEAADRDPNADTDGWGETADHAINESFQFKLTATLEADANYGAYKTYKIQFNDTLSDGVTYEDIVSVKVNGTTIDLYNADSNPNGYKLTEPTVPATELGGGNLTITIDDIKKFDADLTDDATTIEVIYSAHLNANAAVEKASQDSVLADYNNVNKVNLEYSNNPNAGGEGEMGTTPDDYVWVFTYEVDNIKVDEKGDPLPNAGSKLYNASNAEISLIYDADLGAYRPTASGETAEEMKSGHGEAAGSETGKFNIVGLDAGAYTLKETTVPDGYNKCEDIQITISATHKENEDTITAALNLNSTNIDNEIENKKGSTLPSTGGIGTLMFVLCGGVAAGIAGVYLVSKKKTREEEV